MVCSSQTILSLTPFAPLIPPAPAAVTPPFSLRSADRRKADMDEFVAREQRALDWEYIQRVKEANEVLLLLETGEQFRVFKPSATSEMRVQLYAGDEMVKDLSVDRFTREFARLQRRLERKTTSDRLALGTTKTESPLKKRQVRANQKGGGGLIDVRVAFPDLTFSHGIPSFLESTGHAGRDEKHSARHPASYWKAARPA